MLKQLKLEFLALFGKEPDKVEEVEDILSDFQDKVDRLQAVVDRYTDRIRDTVNRQKELSELLVKDTEMKHQATKVKAKLVEFLS